MSHSASHPFSKEPISATGEVFSDGTFIELARSSDTFRPQLIRWRNGEQAADVLIEHGGLQYQPRSIPRSILRSLRLPTSVGSFATARELHGEISALIDKYAGIPLKFSSLAARFVQSTWIVDALETAPTLVIEGPDFERANQLFDLLQCLCRRSLPLSDVTSASLRTLPSGMHFTLLIRQPLISPRLSNLLLAATRRSTAIPHGGELLDLFGAQIIWCDEKFDSGTWPQALLRVPGVSTGDKLSKLNDEMRNQIADEFQSKLLAYRFARYVEAKGNQYDSSKFAMPLRGLANSLAAATPKDVELQAELAVLLEDENNEIRSANWVDLNSVIVESVLVVCREAAKQNVYVGELAEIVGVILKGRGEEGSIDAGEVGRRLKTLGFSTEPRDAKGVKLHLSNKVAAHAQNLANQFEAPGAAETKSVVM